MSGSLTSLSVPSTALIGEVEMTVDFHFLIGGNCIFRLLYFIFHVQFKNNYYLITFVMQLKQCINYVELLTVYWFP